MVTEPLTNSGGDGGGLQSDNKNSIEKIRIEIASRVKTKKKLKKIFKKIDLDKSNSIDQKEFEALLMATMAVKLEDVLFEKVWNIVLNIGNKDGERKNSIDLLGLKSWLFGNNKPGKVKVMEPLATETATTAVKNVF